jgi:hypothetical protein
VGFFVGQAARELRVPSGSVRVTSPMRAGRLGRESTEMTTTPPLVRFCAVAAPGFLLLYGILRLLDGLDGRQDRGLAWNAGHVMFFIAFTLLASLCVGLRQLVLPAGRSRRIIAGAATAAALFGAACFLWGIAGDVFARFHQAAPVPGPLQLVGPLLFQVGSLTLLVQLVTARPRRLPVWSPLLVLLGFVLIAVNLDLLPAGALLILAGLAPLAVAGNRPSAAAGTPAPSPSTVD